MASTSNSKASSRRSEEHTSELQSPDHLVCRLLLEKKKTASDSSLVVMSTRTVPGLLPAIAPLTPRNTSRMSFGKPTMAIIFFFFNDTATTEIYTLSLHDALPI